MKKFLLFVMLYSTAQAEIFDVSIPENDTASYNYADFRIWVNDSTDTLKGIYWFMHPNNGDSRSIVTDSAYQSLVNGQDFALLGAHIFNMHMETGIGDAVIAAMDSFAVQSGHDEISFIPFFINGYSWGGQFGYHFTKWKPERVLGFITQKGGYHDTTDAGEAIEVPGLMFIAENDLQYRIDNLTGIFYDHRPQGAKWILAMEPDVAHTLVVDYPFLDSFFNTVTGLRLPSELNVFEPITMNVIPDSIGWLGNQGTYRIGSWDCYDGVFDSSSWFPSKSIGEHWQDFVADVPTDTSICDHDLDDSYVYFTIGIHGMDSTSNYTITTNEQALIDQCRSQLELSEDERDLHINGYLAYDDGGFNQPWSWHILPNEWELTEMSIGTCNGDPNDVESDLGYWINTVGQLCNWGSFIKEELNPDQYIDSSIVSIIYDFEVGNNTNIADSIFFSNLDGSDAINISYDSIDYLSGNSAMDVTFALANANPISGNLAGLNFTNSNQNRMDLSSGDTLSIMLKVEEAPSFPEHMFIRLMVADRPVFYGFDEFWAGDDSFLIDQESDWMEVKIPLKTNSSNSITSIIGSDINDGFNISPYWWNLQYNNWQLDLDRISQFAILIGTHGYGSDISSLPADQVTLSLDRMAIKDSSGHEHIFNFHDQLDDICLSPENERQGLLDNLADSIPELPYIEIRDGITAEYAGVDSDGESYSMAHFLFFADSDHDLVAVSGSWNDWNGTLWNMSNIPGTNFWFKPMVMPDHGRFNYAYWAGGSYYDDPLNDITCMAWNYGITDQVSGPDYEIPYEWSYNDSIQHGTYFDTTFYSSTMDNSREITVYLPPEYESTDDFYPVVVYNDGDRILPREPNNIFDNLIHNEQISPIIAVFIPPVNRNAEFRTYQQETYTSFVIEEVLAWAMEKYRILEGSDNHATVGFSDGGCIAIYQGLTRYDFFGKMGAFAPTINIAYNQIVQEFSGVLPDLEIYMEGYWYDNLLWQGLAFRDTLISNDFNVTWNDFPDGHELCAVMGNQDILLEQFFGLEELNTEAEPDLMPNKLNLHAPYPNPFNPSTNIRFEIPTNFKDHVKINIFDVRGRMIEELIDEQVDPGKHEIRFEAFEQGTGIYFIQLLAGEQRLVKKLILLK